MGAMSLNFRQRRYSGARYILIGLIIIFITPRIALIFSDFALMVEIIGVILCCANCLYGCSEINRSNQVDTNDESVDSSDENRLEYINGENNRRSKRKKKKKSNKRKSSSVSELCLSTFIE